MLLQFWPWQNFRQVHRLLLFQMSAPVLVTGMMARLTLQGVTGRSIMSFAVLTRFLEGCSGSRRGGGICRGGLPSLGSPRRHLLLRLETWKAFHLSRRLNSPTPVTTIHKSPYAHYEISNPSTSPLLQPTILLSYTMAAAGMRSCNQLLPFPPLLQDPVTK